MVADSEEIIPLAGPGGRPNQMFARKIRVEVLRPEGATPCAIRWLDSFCMRSFTGRTAFDETLPIRDGEIEAGFHVDLDGLRVDMEDWMTRKFGGGNPVKLRMTEDVKPSGPM